MSVLAKSAGTQIACRIGIGLQRRNAFFQKNLNLGQAKETNKLQQTFKAKQLPSRYFKQNIKIYAKRNKAICS